MMCVRIRNFSRLPFPMRTYTYSHRRTLLITVLIMVPGLLIDLYKGEISDPYRDFLIPFLFIGGATYLLYFRHTLNQSLKLQSRSLTLARRLGNSVTVPFAAMRRIAVRRTEGPWGTDHLELTVFDEEDSTTVDLEGLEEQQDLLRQLEARGQEHNFAMVYQNEEGEIVTRRELEQG